jgi:hypothetical protein
VNRKDTQRDATEAHILKPLTSSGSKRELIEILQLLRTSQEQVYVAGGREGKPERDSHEALAHRVD